jgi:molybdopterin-guanine dinucleotide biosynthesis protein B
MKLLLIVGKKKAGKTALIEKLLSGLTSKGYKLGSIKHTTHDHQFDREGTDSFRHARAGAQTTLLMSPNKRVVFSDSLKNKDFDDLLGWLFDGCDLIIGEGFKESRFPKIEVLGDGTDGNPLCTPEDNLLAVVGEKKPGLPLLHFRKDQVDQIMKFVEERLLNRANKTEAP